MSGESADDTQDPDGDSSVEPVASVGAADSIVPAFEVPAPELVDVPDAETAAADFAVPPPPKFETPAVPPAPGKSDVPPPSDATWSSERTWKSRSTWISGEDSKPSAASEARAARQTARSEAALVESPTAESSAPASRAALRGTATSDLDRGSVVPPPVPQESSYRGWTIAIFAGLAVLFFGAIGFMAFLGLSG